MYSLGKAGDLKRGGRENRCCNIVVIRNLVEFIFNNIQFLPWNI
jgi:hypothetical protein